MFNLLSVLLFLLTLSVPDFACSSAVRVTVCTLSVPSFVCSCVFADTECP